MDTQIISLANQKGGVGKTTTAINLGIGLARQGKNVLLLDADPQGDLTKCLGVKDPKALRHTIATCMDHLIAHGEEDKPSDFVYTDAIRQHDEGVDFIPANAGLAATEVTLVNSMSRETVLRQYLDVVKQEYDYVLIDCRPSLGLTVINALTAADSVIIPSAPDFLSTKGLNLLIRTISRVRRQINPKLKIDGILMTMVDGRTNNAKSIIASLRSTLGGSVRVFDTEIPRSVRAAEASGEGKSIFAFDPKSRVTCS